LISASVYGRDAAATDSMAMDERNFAFKIATPIGFAVRGPQTYWNFSVAHKHLILRGHEKEIKTALRDPDEIRCGRKDSSVLLFYRGGSPGRICALARRENAEGFLITA